jgi:hypothetical protein
MRADSEDQRIDATARAKFLTKGNATAIDRRISTRAAKVESCESESRANLRHKPSAG